MSPKKANNRLLTRAAQKCASVFAGNYRAATVRERTAGAFFSSLCKYVAAVWCLAAPVLAAQPSVTREGGYWVRVISGAEAIAPTARLRVAARGEVTVTGGENRELTWTLKGRSRVSGERAARSRLASLGVRVTRQSGDSVSFTVQSAGDDGVLRISVPSALREVSVATDAGSVETNGLTRVSIATGGGEIKADRISGSLEARTAGGPITLGDIGGAVHCSTAGGSIAVRTIRGEAVLESGAGDIVVQEVRGFLRALTVGGAVRIARAGSGVFASSGGGSIDVGQAGGAVEVRNSGGTVRVGSTSGVRCENASGAIRLINVSGGLRASTSIGSILAQLTAGGVPADSFLATGGGDITVLIPSNVGVKIRAENAASGGLRRIVSDFPGIAVRAAGPQVIAEGNINGGGPLLRISGAGGTIFIRRE
jgi:DUF4097 and DUF4098 domain-containing protein YvlB